jgi:hypothetical protein
LIGRVVTIRRAAPDEIAEAHASPSA